MVNPTVRGRGGVGTGTRPRSLMTAARAAARRAEKAQGPDAAAAGETGGSATDQEKRAEPKGAEKRGAEPRGAAEETDVEKEPVATAAKRSPVRSGIPGAVLAVLVLAGLIATALLAPEYYDAERTRQARTSALAAAQKAAPVILSYDYRHLDRDFEAARGHLTGSFVDKYRKTTSTVVEPTAKKYKGVVKATVAKPPVREDSGRFSGLGLAGPGRRPAVHEPDVEEHSGLRSTARPQPGADDPRPGL